ncbi:proline-rich protein 36-like [Drosophila ficusphila]|uniref:proline-rich protein 36-like n=1 Tax=Drosophila ficusphila TaxID=30025 RepID=UPI001C896A50|nr:proline-rich protein 36-like [Drosophila ficusphila]
MPRERNTNSRRRHSRHPEDEQRRRHRHHHHRHDRPANPDPGEHPNTAAPATTMPAIEELHLAGNATSPRHDSRPPTPTGTVAADTGRPPRPPSAAPAATGPTAPATTADSDAPPSPAISPTWCEGLTYEDVVASIFEAEEEPDPAVPSVPVSPTPVGPLGATYEEVSDAEVVTLSSDDDEPRGAAMETVVLLDEEETVPWVPPHQETPPPSYEELFGPGPYPEPDPPASAGVSTAATIAVRATGAAAAGTPRPAPSATDAVAKEQATPTFIAADDIADAATVRAGASTPTGDDLLALLLGKLAASPNGPTTSAASQQREAVRAAVRTIMATIPTAKAAGIPPAATAQPDAAAGSAAGIPPAATAQPDAAAGSAAGIPPAATAQSDVATGSAAGIPPAATALRDAATQAAAQPDAAVTTRAPTPPDGTAATAAVAAVLPPRPVRRVRPMPATDQQRWRGRQPLANPGGEPVGRPGILRRPAPWPMEEASTDEELGEDAEEDEEDADSEEELPRWTPCLQTPRSAPSTDGLPRTGGYPSPSCAVLTDTCASRDAGRCATWRR